jgi:hypothetical protein
MQILFINILMDGASPSALATALAVALVVPDLMVFILVRPSKSIAWR